MHHEAAKWLLVAGLVIVGIGGAGASFDKTHLAGRMTAAAGFMLMLISMLYQA